MNKKVQAQIEAIKQFIVYNYNNGNVGLFLNAFAQRFFYLSQLKNKENNEEYKWLVYLFESAGIKPVLHKGGKITYENIELPADKKDNKKENPNLNQEKKFFQKKKTNKIDSKQNFMYHPMNPNVIEFNSIESLLNWIMKNF